MTRIVFFSFDYDDVWRVNQVRNSGRFIGEPRSGFRDKAEYEKVRRTGDAAIRNWIRKQMHGCSVTCVLIGAATHRSRWVNFEIKESIANGMGLLGVYVHKLRKSKDHQSAVPGPVLDAILRPANPLDKHKIPPFRNTMGYVLAQKASERFMTYTWEPAGNWSNRVNDLGEWVEEAARRAGR